MWNANIVFEHRTPRVTCPKSPTAAACLESLGARSNGPEGCHVFDGHRPLSLILRGQVSQVSQVSQVDTWVFQVPFDDTAVSR